MKHRAVFSCKSGMAPEIYHALTPEIGEINPRTEVGVTLVGDDLLVISLPMTYRL
ncbi:MAG: hypothetical protein LUP92_04745 [Methanomicrobiales archaeon]|nr:hypothetical protein [Methanomicrobiales archaeon]